MTGRRYTALFMLTAAAALVINLIAGYYTLGAPADRRMIENADRYLSALSFEQYPDALRELNEEYGKLREYREALAVINGGGSYKGVKLEWAEETAASMDLTYGQAAARQEQISFCAERLSCALEYGDYVRTVKSNAAAMAGVSIFSGKEQKNILRAGTDFYGLENIRVSAVSDAGVRILFADRVTDISAVIASLVCAAFFTLRCRASAGGDMLCRSRLPLFSAIFTAVIILMYAENVMICPMLGDTGRAVQSVAEYRSCPRIMSVAALICVRIIFKAAACLFIFLLCAAALSADKKPAAAAVTALLLLTELILTIRGGDIRFGALFDSQDIVGKYANTFIMGEAVSSVTLLTVFAAALIIIGIWAANTRVNRMLGAAREQAERKYYDEINEKYNESRMIRHDIRNHLTAVATLLDEGRISEARSYLKEVSEQLDSVRPPVKTGSAVLDALLFSKNELMRGMGISARMDFAATFEDAGISEYDLCGIFGNILDNAAEACSRLPEEERRITLSVRRQMDMICIFCENRYAVISEGLETTKPDKASHGMGLARVRRIAEKHGGTLEISAAEGVFSLSVIINSEVKL